MRFDFKLFEQWLHEEMTFEYLFAKISQMLELDVMTSSY